MKKELVDKGFELCYYNLSYRRRFIRTIWIFFWGILLVFIMPWIGLSLGRIIKGAFLIVLIGIPQAIDDYKMWQKEKKQQAKKKGD